MKGIGVVALNDVLGCGTRWDAPSRGGLVVQGRITPLARRDMVYFCLGAYRRRNDPKPNPFLALSSGGIGTIWHRTAIARLSHGFAVVFYIDME